MRLGWAVCLLSAGCTAILGIGEPGGASGDDDDTPQSDGGPPADAPPPPIDATPPVDAAPPEDLFEPRVFIATGTFTRGVAIGDVDEDTFLDIVAVNRGTSDVSVIRGLGGRNFAAKVDFAAGSLPESVVLSDVDGDGHLDLVVGSGSDNTIVVRLNDPMNLGSFLAPSSLPVGDQPLAMVAADIVGGGRHEIFFCGNNTAKLLTPSGGTLTIVEEFSGPTYGRCGAGVIDLDGDAHPDLTSKLAPGAQLIRQDPADPGTFLTPMSISAGDAMSIQALAVGDVNGDGRPDLVTAGVKVGGGGLAPTSAIHLQDLATPGTFLAPISLEAGAPMPHYAGVVIGAFGGGALPDVALVDEGADTLEVFIDVTGAPASGRAVDESTGNGPRALAVGHLDADGKLDLVTADNLAGGVSVFFHR